VTADLHSVAAEALEAVAAAPDLAALDAVRTRYLGRGDGVLTSFRRGLGKIPDADGRRQMGQMVNELVQVYAIGKDICAIFDTRVGLEEGHGVTIYVREGDDWKIRMTYVTF